MKTTLKGIGALIGLAAFGLAGGCGDDGGSETGTGGAGNTSATGGQGGCPANLTDCMGTCVDTAVDPNNCGACGMSCGAGQICDGSGTCEVTCQQGLIDCAGTCVDPMTSNAFCGATGDCMGANAGTACMGGEVCANGSCAVSCPPNQILCDGTCVDPQTSNAYCGATGDCTGANAGATCAAGEVCASGSCALSCPPNQIECGGSCVDPQTSNAYCGASGDCTGGNAGTACVPGQLCSGGTCALNCQAALIDCDGTCVDPQTSNAYCGASGDCTGGNAGATCGAGEICSGGSCALNCQAGLIDCDGTCVDPQVNNTYCGASGDCTGGNAGATCGAGEICSGGSCTPNCPSNQILCSNTCVNPDYNPMYCGATGDCTGANAGTACSSDEACVSGSCLPLGACDWDSTLFPVALTASNSVGAMDIDGSCDLMFIGSDGNLNRLEYNTTNLTTVETGIASPRGLAWHAAQGLTYFHGQGNIYAVAPGGTASQVGTVTLDGTDNGMAVAPSGWGNHGGSLIIGTSGGNVYAVDVTNFNATLLGTTSGDIADLAFDGQTLYVANYGGNAIETMTPTGTFATFAATSCGVDGLAVRSGTAIYATCSAADDLRAFTLPGGNESVLTPLPLNQSWAPTGIVWDGVDDLLLMEENTPSIITFTP